MNENNQMQTSVKDVQQQIAQRFGFEDLSDEKQQSLIQDMTESVIKRVMVDSFERLSEVDKKTFEEIMEGQDAEALEKIDAFLIEKLPNYSEIIKEAVDDLEKHMKEAMASVE